MIKHDLTVINRSGDVLAGRRVQVLDSAGSIVSIFADSGGTRFQDSAGADVDYATTDERGYAAFYWTPASGQDLQVLDASGNLERPTVVDFASKEADSSAFQSTATGSVARTKDAKLDEMASVLDFGATGDAVADDTTAIQSAISESKDLFLPAGNYRITSSLTLAGVNLHGEGVGNTIITFDPAVNGDALFDVASADHWSAEGIEFVGPGRDTGTNEVCFDMFNPSATSEFMWVIQRCKFLNWNKAAIYLGGQWTGTIQDNLFQNCGDTTDIPGGSVATFSGGVVFEENGGAANWAGSGNDIANNYFTGCSYGVYNSEGWNVTLRNNIFEYCGFPYFKSETGTLMVDINNWMEDFGSPTLYQPPVIQGNVFQVGGRATSGADNPRVRTFDAASSYHDFFAYAGTQNCYARIEATRHDISTAASKIRFQTTDTGGTSRYVLELGEDGSLLPILTNQDLGSTGHPWRNSVMNGHLKIGDGVAEPAVAAGFASIFVDTADGDLKVKFGDGTVATIATDT